MSLGRRVTDHWPGATFLLLLEGADVSRAHCRIDVEGDEVNVTDLNSTNGTFVDSDRLSGTAPLPHGTLLRVGNYLMTCEYQSVLQHRGSRQHARNAGTIRSVTDVAAATRQVGLGNKTEKSG